MKHRQRFFALLILAAGPFVYFGFHLFRGDTNIVVSMEQERDASKVRFKSRPNEKADMTIKKVARIQGKRMYDRDFNEIISKNAHGRLSEHNKSIAQTGNSDLVVAIKDQLQHIPASPTYSRISDYYVDDFYQNLNFSLGDQGLYDVTENGVHLGLKNVSNSKPLKIIVVPHSHNDPGWLWTLNMYYESRTKNILTSTVTFLNSHPDFRMIWSETIFLKMWWDEADIRLKTAFKNLVDTGKVEILSGGWVSVDEATTHYTAVLDQLIEGHQWLKDTLNVHVNTSWSIDPFGYSMSLPYLWKKAGMKNMAILRIHGAIKQRMAHRKLLTYKWRQQWDKSGAYDIQCHVEPYTLYNIEHSCGPDMGICKIMDYARYSNLPAPGAFNLPDGRRIKGFAAYVEKLVQQYRQKASNYKQNVILLPHGDDFRYIHEYEWKGNYDNLVKVMKLVNSRPDWNIQMKFGTVGEYFDLLDEEIDQSEEKESTLTGDYFTYTDRDNEYWSGYYTTRPFDKRNIRWMLELLRNAEILTTYTIIKTKQSGRVIQEKNLLQMLQEARRTHGLVQHHDAITGTSARTTVEDFRLRIFNAIHALQKLTTYLLTFLLPVPNNISYLPTGIQQTPFSPKMDYLVNVTRQGRELVLINTHTQPRVEIVSICANSSRLGIFDQSGNKIKHQIVPYWSDQGEMLQSVFKIYFQISIHPGSIMTYTVKESKTVIPDSISTIHVYNKKFANQNQRTSPFKFFEMGELRQKTFSIHNSHLHAHFSSKSGLLRAICNSQEPNSCSNVNLELRTYQTGNSNAYCFGTKVDSPVRLIGEGEMIKVVSGDLVSQVILHHPILYHQVDLYNTTEIQGESLHVTNMVRFIGPDKRDKELIMSLRSDILKNNNQYFTDSNGFQMVKRQYRSNLPYGANFYPMTNMVFVENDFRRLTIHSAQAHGVGSFGNGELLVMVERMPTSSGKGLEEPVEDNKPTLSKFVLTLENKMSTANVNSLNKIYHPSIKGHAVNDILQNPVQVYQSSDYIYNQRDLVKLFSQDFRSDFTIANVKTLIDSKLQLKGTGLTIHRKQFSEDFKHILDKNEEMFPIHTLFSGLKIANISQTTLTHTRHLQNLNNVKNVKIDPGELESFYIQWNS